MYFLVNVQKNVPDTNELHIHIHGGLVMLYTQTVELVFVYLVTRVTFT